jgi:hypothetical protein
MKKISKLVLVLLASLSVSFAAVAGELSVTGTAKASYTIGGADKNAGKGYGISNEIGLSASGELDNGYTWNYALALDPASGGTVDQDDSSLTLGTPYGTVGMFISAGGLGTETGFGIGALGVGADFKTTNATGVWVVGSDISDYNNIQYHSPAGLIPFGVVVKVGYTPNLSNTNDGLDYKSEGVQASQDLGTSATHYNISATPIDGLVVGGDYFETDGGVYKKTPTNGNLYANYTYGPVKVGYLEGYRDIALTTTAASGDASNYDLKSFGVQFAVNEALTLSYSEEELTKRTRASIVDGAAKAVKTGVAQTLTSLQAAYNIGGATVGIARQEMDNAEFSTTGGEETATLLSLAMAF